MNDEKTFERKIWRQISALTSGILTSLLYELLAGSSYKLDIAGTQYEIISTGMETWPAIGLVTLIFFALWAVFSLIVPWVARIRKRFTYAQVKKSTAKGLMKTLDEVKMKIAELYPIFYSQKGTPLKGELIKIHGRDLEVLISLLHKEFLPQGTWQKKRVEQYFRCYKYRTIETITNKVSAYELASDVSLLKDMVAQLKMFVGDDKLLEHDCTEMEEMLGDFEKMAVLTASSKVENSAQS